MRLFVAVDFSPDAIEQAVRVAGALRRRASGNLRWVPPASMHLTVRFIGHVAERAEALIAALSEPLAFDPFEMALGGCGAFPPTGAVRVVWIGLRSGAAELTRLSAIMDERVRPFGFEPEERPFSPHLTLARAGRNERIPRQFREVLAQVAVRPAVTHVAQAVVYQSHLSPRGARYEPVAAIPFTGECQIH